MEPRPSPTAASSGYRIPAPDDFEACEGAAVRQFRGGFCECLCGALVKADPITGEPLRHERTHAQSESLVNAGNPASGAGSGIRASSEVVSVRHQARSSASAELGSRLPPYERAHAQPVPQRSDWSSGSEAGSGSRVHEGSSIHLQPGAFASSSWLGSRLSLRPTHLVRAQIDIPPTKPRRPAMVAAHTDATGSDGERGGT